MKGKFKYLFTWVDHFSKYAWAIPIRNKEAIIARNAIAHVFMSGYPEMLQTDNGKEFTNNKLKSYLEGISFDHIFGAPYHPQSQGAIKALNKTIQRALSAAYDNVIQEKDEWDLELNLFRFLHYYNWSRKHTTTGEVPKFVIVNFNDSLVKERGAIATENSREKKTFRKKPI